MVALPVILPFIAGCDREKPALERVISDRVQVVFHDNFADNAEGWSDVLVGAVEDRYAIILPDEKEVFENVWFVPGSEEWVTSSLYLRPSLDLGTGPARITLRVRGNGELLREEGFGVELHGSAGEQFLRAEFSQNQPARLVRGDGDEGMPLGRVPVLPDDKATELRIVLLPENPETVTVRFEILPAGEEEFSAMGTAVGLPLKTLLFDDLRIFHRTGEGPDDRPCMMFGEVIVEQLAYE